MSCISRGARAVVGLSTCLGIAASCGGGGGGGGDGTGGSGLVDGASVSPTPIVAAQTSFPGEFAADYLRRVRFTSLVVEIDYVEGHAPSSAALVLLQDRLEERCDKPGGVIVLVDDEIPDADVPATTSVAQLEDLENAYRDLYSDSSSQQAVLYLLYVTGRSSLAGGPGTEILGLTYHGSSIVLYVDAADQGSDPFVTTAEVEGTAIVHEAGHALGLVNSGVPMVVPHEDADHAGHDADESSVMYWVIDIDPVYPSIGSPEFARYGQRCEDDLAAVGGLPASPLPVVAPTGPLAVRRAASREVVGTCGTCLARARATAAAGAAGACAAR